MKTCNRCFKLQPLIEFYPHKQTKDGYTNQCKTCKRDQSRLIKREHAKNGTGSEQVLRIKALDILGNKCIRCGFSDARALQIDHIHGGGWQERKTPGYNRRQVERKIVAGETHDYQLLCANCNWIKRAENNETSRLYYLEQ